MGADFGGGVRSNPLSVLSRQMVIDPIPGIGIRFQGKYHTRNARLAVSLDHESTANNRKWKLPIGWGEC